MTNTTQNIEKLLNLACDAIKSEVCEKKMLGLEMMKIISLDLTDKKLIRKTLDVFLFYPEKIPASFIANLSEKVEDADLIQKILDYLVSFKTKKDIRHIFINLVHNIKEEKQIQQALDIINNYFAKDYTIVQPVIALSKNVKTFDLIQKFINIALNLPSFEGSTIMANLSLHVKEKSQVQQIVDYACDTSCHYRLDIISDNLALNIKDFKLMQQVIDTFGKKETKIKSIKWCRILCLFGSTLFKEGKKKKCLKTLEISINLIEDGLKIYDTNHFFVYGVRAAQVDLQEAKKLITNLRG